jgi:hypothetical protein
MNMKKTAIIGMLALFIVSIVAASGLALDTVKTVTPKYTVVHMNAPHSYWMPAGTIGKLELSKQHWKSGPVVVRATPVKNYNARMFGTDIGLTKL